jgi:hypothetical protein
MACSAEEQCEGVRKVVKEASAAYLMFVTMPLSVRLHNFTPRPIILG